MGCPYCDQELEYDDYFGPHIGGGKIKRVGVIYKCQNESCESEEFNFHFYEYDGSTELHEGYPC